MIFGRQMGVMKEPLTGLIHWQTCRTYTHTQEEGKQRAISNLEKLELDFTEKEEGTERFFSQISALHRACARKHLTGRHIELRTVSPLGNFFKRKGVAFAH